MAETVQMPKLGFDMAEGTLVRWVKAEGESVTKGEVLAEIETDKATVEVEAPYSGIVARHLVAQKDVVPVGTPIAIIAAPGEKLEESSPAPQVVASPPPTPPPSGTPKAPLEEIPAPTAAEAGPIKVSPLARRMAGERKIDLSQLKGSGPGGRIVRRDIEAALSGAQATLTTQPFGTPAVVLPPAPPVSLAGAIPADQSITVTKLRAAIGRRMVESKQQLPHFYVTHVYDSEPLLTLRRQFNEWVPDGEKLSVNDFIIKAAALCLRQFPNLNASLVGNEIVQHGHVNIGVAVSLDSGLLTVVCRDADQKPLRQVSSEVREMVSRARNGKVKPEDIEGSTFSISNLGMFDVEHFTAIINPPEAAILAVGSAQAVPVVVDGELRPGMRMKMTLSVDHRVSDGAEAAKFMQKLAEFIEKPLVLMM